MARRKSGPGVRSSVQLLLLEHQAREKMDLAVFFVVLQKTCSQPWWIVSIRLPASS